MASGILIFPPIFWALLGALGVSAWSIMGRKILKDEKDFLATGAVCEISSLLIVVLAFFIFGSSIGGAQALDLASIPIEGWIALLISVPTYTLAMLLIYKAYQTGEAGERAVVNQLQNVFVILLGWLILGEVINGAKIIGGALIIIGSVLAIYRKGGTRWHIEGVRLFAVVSILYAIGILADKVATKYIPILIYAQLLFAIPAVALIFILGKKAQERMKKIVLRHKWNIALLALFTALPYIFFLMALVNLPASVVGPIFNINVILTVLGGMILLDEKEGWKQKVVGALLAFIGAIILGG